MLPIANFCGGLRGDEPYPRCAPPSTGMIRPVVDRASSRNSAALAISTGCGRGKGITGAFSCIASGARTAPGAMAFILALGARSFAACKVQSRSRIFDLA